MGGNIVKSVAILGAGRIAWVHAKALSQMGVKIACVFDVIEHTAQKLAHTVGAVVTDSATSAIAHPHVTAVYICTPTGTHIDFIEQSVHAGKAVFCEKPLSLDVSLARQCAENLKHSDVPIMMGFNRRFDPTHMAVKQAVHNGDIGHIHNLMIISRDPRLPPLSYVEHSGGLFMDMTIHDFDMTRYILGDKDKIVSVFASGGVRINPDIIQYNDIDTGAVYMQSASGVLCQILNSRQAVYGYDQRVEVFGSNGMVQSDNMHENTMIKYIKNTPKTQARLEDFFLQRYADSYRLQSESFWQSVTQNTPVATTVQDGLQAMELAKIAEKSLRQNQWVQV